MTSSSTTQDESTKTQFDTGAVREKRLGDRVRWDLLDSNDVALRRLAETFAEGYKKYGADNWKKGFPASELYNHAREHMLSWISGDKSEDHLAHAVWNLCALMWQEEKKPEQMDYPLRPEFCNVAKVMKHVNNLACPLFEGTPRQGEEFHETYVYGVGARGGGRCNNCGAPRSRHYKGLEIGT